LISYLKKSNILGKTGLRLLGLCNWSIGVDLVSLFFSPRPPSFRLIPGVQPVTDEAYEAVVKLGTQGGWEDLVVKPSKAKAKVATKSKAKANAEAEIGTSPEDQVKEKVLEKESKKTHKAEDKKATKAKAARPPTPTPTEGTRRSKRVKVEH
jgi:hypothetical protein